MIISGTASLPNANNQPSNNQYAAAASQFSSSPSMPGTTLTSQNSALPQVSNVAALAPNNSPGMADSQVMCTPNASNGSQFQQQTIASRSQVSGMNQMAQSPHATNFSPRPVTTKQPVQVMGTSGAAGGLNSHSNQGTPQSTPGGVYYVRDQHNHNVQNAAPAQRSQEQSVVQPPAAPVPTQPHVPTHVPEVIPAPVSQTVPNPYRQGSFEANG